jgi:hypothetical protein
VNDKPYTLDEYNKDILEPAIARFKAAAIADGIMRDSIIDDMLAMGYT